MGEKTENSDVRFTVMENKDWSERWNVGEIGFHNTFIHPLLQRNIGQLIGDQKNLRVFVPLCGKTLDMKWLASQGYTVFGVELAEKALLDFFQENDIPFTTEAAPSVDGIIFKSDDGRIILYCCDLFRISNDAVGQFDIIWDRGSLVAINREDREKYAALIKSLMAPGCKYLACTVEYDETKHKGPPHNVTDDAMQKLYGDTCEVIKADREDAIEDKHRQWGLTSFFENLYVVEQKQS